MHLLHRVSALPALLLAVLLTTASCSQKRAVSLQLSSEADLAGLKVCTINGSYYAFDLADRDDIELLLYNSGSDVVQAVITGKADVAVMDETTIDSQLRSEYGLRIAFKGDEQFPTALMFRKDRQDLVDAMNTVQRRMRQDGSLDSLERLWLDEQYLEGKEFRHIPVETEGIPLKVAVITNLAPVSFISGDDWYGIEPDLARELARELHRPIEFKLYDMNSGMMALRTGSDDMMLGSIFVTAEREEQYAFAEPYHGFRAGYFVRDEQAAASSVGVWQSVKDSLYKNLVKEARWKYIVQGLWTTIVITLLAILFGSILGAGLCALARSRSKWARKTAAFYNWLIAGIPMLVLLLIAYYIIFTGDMFSATAVAVIAFSLNFASGASDVYDTSLNAVPLGQTEGGLALGFTKLQTFVHIVLPQALRHGVPLYQAQCISLLKGTAIVGYIAITDLTRAGDMIRARTFDAIVPLLLVTVLYFVLAWLLGLLVKAVTPRKKAL